MTSAMWDMIRERARSERGAPRPRAVARTGPVPLSPTQLRLWQLDQLGPLAYHVTLARTLRGNLDHAAFRAAARELINRHEALRTVFTDTPDGPAQLVVPEADVTLLIEDGTAADVPAWTQRHIGAVCDLARGPLLRIGVLRTGRQEHLLVFAVHHIVADGWSLKILLAELVALYRARLDGTTEALPPVRLHQIDFVAWQRDWLTGAVLDRYLAYWSGQDLPIGHRLPALPRDEVPEPNLIMAAGRVGFGFDERLTHAVHDLARRTGTTLFTVLLTGFHVLLWQESGHAEVLVGSPAANRGTPELSGIVGYLVNVVPIRGVVDASLDFLGLLYRTASAVGGAYAHQALPLERFIQLTTPEVAISDAYPLATLFALHGFDRSGVALPGLTDHPFELEYKQHEFALSICLFEDGGTLGGYLSYRLDHYTKATAGRLADRFGEIIRAACAQPRCPVHRLG